MQRSTRRQSTSPPPPLSRSHHGGGGGFGSTQAMVLDEDAGGSFHRNIHNVSSSVLRHRDPSSMNNHHNPKGDSWKAVGGRTQTCMVCGAMGECSCDKGRAISPNTRRQRQKSILTPYEAQKQEQYLQRVFHEEGKYRALITREYTHLMEKSYILMCTHWRIAFEEFPRYKAEVRRLTHESMTEASLFLTEELEMRERKSIRSHRLEDLNLLFAEHEDGLQRMELSTIERHRRYRIEAAEHDNFKVLCFSLEDNARFVERCEEQKTQFVQDAFHHLNEIKKKEEYRWDALMQCMQAEEQRQYENRKEREDFETQVLERLFKIREQQEEKRNNIRLLRNEEHEEVLELLRFQVAQRQELMTDYLFIRDQGINEEDLQRMHIHNLMADSMEEVHQITQSKTHRREAALNHFLELAHEIQKVELDHRLDIMNLMDQEKEQRFQWIQEKEDDRQELFEQARLEIQGAVIEAEVDTRNTLMKRFHSEMKALEDWMENNAKLRSRLLDKAISELNILQTEEMDERKILRQNMDHHESLVLEWIGNRSEQLAHFMNDELTLRAAFVDKEASTRSSLMSSFNDFLRNLESKRVEFLANAITLEQNYEFEARLILAEFDDGLRNLRTQKNTSCTLALDRQDQREQREFTEEERLDRNTLMLVEVDSRTNLIAWFESGKEEQRHARQQAFQFECDSLAHEEKILRDGLIAQQVDGYRLIASEEPLSKARALTAERDRKEAELAARQQCLKEDRRVYDTLTEMPLPDEQESTFATRTSMRASITKTENARKSWWPGQNVKQKEEEELQEMKAFIVSALPALAPHLETMRRCELEAFMAALEQADEYRAEDARMLEEIHARTEKLKAKQERVEREVNHQRAIQQRVKDEMENGKKKHKKIVKSIREENSKKEQELKGHRGFLTQQKSLLKKAQETEELLKEAYHRKTSSSSSFTKRR